NNHFKEINPLGDGHKGWECLYCKEKNSHATDLNMNTYLALNCKKVDCESLEVKEIIDLNVFVEEQVDEPNNNNIIEPEDETDYDINEVVSAAMNNTE
ncbi:19073_t:CDS:2, partial [Gigaspora rosea]